MVKLKFMAMVSLMIFLFCLIPLLTVDATIVAWIRLGTDPSGDAFLAEVADSEHGAGEVWKGDYTYTHSSDSKREYLRETEVNDGYQLEWIYTFTSFPPRDDTKFYIEGRTTEDDIDENMTVEWSNSLNGSWSFLGNVTTAPERVYGPWDIPDDTAHTIYIRIRDTIRNGDKRSGILIDHMYIACIMDEADKTELYFYNDDTYAFFNETLVGPPDKSSFTYIVYLDKPAYGRYSVDFRLVYSSSGAHLQKWDENTGWVYVEDITVTESSSSHSICFSVSLDSIANPKVQQNKRAWFVEYYGANNYTAILDRAPDTGEYFIHSEVIPELPWPAPLVFVPVVVATIWVLYARRFRRT